MCVYTIDVSTARELCIHSSDCVVMTYLAKCHCHVTHSQMIALGVIFHRGSYFRSFFNMIDFIVVVTSLIPLVYYGVVATRNGGDITVQENV